MAGAEEVEEVEAGVVDGEEADEEEDGAVVAVDGDRDDFSLSH